MKKIGKKSCLTCEFFGMCDINVEVCEDWVPFGGQHPIQDIDAFTSVWIKTHTTFFKRWKNTINRKEAYKKVKERYEQQEEGK